MIEGGVALSSTIASAENPELKRQELEKQLIDAQSFLNCESFTARHRRALPDETISMSMDRMDTAAT